MKSNLANYGPNMSSKVEYCGFYALKMCVSCLGNLSDHEVTQTATKHTKMGEFLIDTAPNENSRTVAVFRCKMAFLKSKFKDDPVRVQRRAVPHFKDFE